MKVVQRVFKWSSVLGLLPVTLGLGAWAGWTWWSRASAPPQLIAPSTANETAAATAVQVRIPPGTAAQQIGSDLEAAGLIRSSLAWELWAHWLEWQDPKGSGFKAGTYQLSPNQPLSAIAQKIWRGEVVQRSFTIPEGWSLRQMAAYFEDQGFFPAQDFLVAASQIPRHQYPWLPADLPNLEGFLYPDTYNLNGDRVTPKAVVEQMLNRFQQVALPLYQQIDTQNNSSTSVSESEGNLPSGSQSPTEGNPPSGLSHRTQLSPQLNLRQWVTLASIVEKEAVVPNERPRIAGVFSKRLRQGLPLGADPTVEYGLGIRQSVDRPLTLAEVKTPSPYNTYLNPGLPPTPIASPGLASLKAALYPENTPYLYFVARYDGTHVFSRTLAEHQAAQAAIQKQQKVRSHK